MSTAHEKPEWAQSRHDKRNAERVAQGQKPKRRIWPWLIPVVIVVGIGAFIFLQPSPPAEESVEQAPVARQVRQSETTTIEQAMLRDTVKVTGTLVPGQRSDVSAQASGRVMTVMVRPGDRVAEGDVLAQIDRATLELQLNQQRATASATRAQLQSSEQQLERTEQLAIRGTVTASALEQARSATAALVAQLDALDSAVATAELAVENATVTAPLTGIVSARTVEPGQTVQTGTALFTIVNLDRMEFEAAASANSSALVDPGQAATVSVTGLDNQEFAGEVTRVNPVAMSGTRTVPIYIDIDNAESRLRGGMFATGHITVIEQDNAIAVPAAALREDAEGQFVLKLAGTTLERQPVETVRQWSRGSLVEVTGLQAGDQVISSPLAELKAGEAYELVEG
ncbi:MAG: efflux RND transporter periplasmic adaptor subunit [Candidatus Devosia phytovorans]|uniref:Efflux RND transporter periplasmic adaptor subunit n=1 Tax=Candidatus Devosia phytovorans TaxID=3121372 RepID=A0AAJ6AXU5_9HYPH|nr:efflux RND transporter periplasmic adaptor subunit [Devosia sp.]WEK02885.1 MAG: efflux RND transporter periplasmic adaptor subunit [Devosia sp.]